MFNRICEREKKTHMIFWFGCNGGSLQDDTTKGTVKNELDHIVWQKVAGW